MEMSEKPRRRRRRSNSASRRLRRSRSRNPGIAATFRGGLGNLTAGFKPAALINAGTIAAGAFGNYWLREQVTARFLPGARTGLMSYGVGLATAGAMLMVPKVGQQLFLGGLLEETMRAAKEFLFPSLRFIGDFLTAERAAPMGPVPGMSALDEDDYTGLEGLAEALTVDSL